MKTYSKMRAVLAVIVAWAGLAACGGSSTSTTPTPAPTGVVSVGVVTGFGSVYVNGVRFDTSGAQVSVNGSPATESALQVGHVVRIRGHAQGAAHSADVIRYNDVLAGPITSVDATASSFVAMGQTVRVTSQTSLGTGIVPASIDGLAVGAVVEVSGLVSSSGVIDATRIDLKTNAGPYDVTGYVSDLTAASSRLQINALSVDYSSANLDGFPSSGPALGNLVLVKGTVFNPDGSFVATRVELRFDDWLTPAAGDHVEVEGIITDFVSATDFKVSGWPVTTTASTVYERGTAADLANDVKVEVEGTADAAGTLVAGRIIFRQVNTVRIVAQVGALSIADRSMTLLGLQVATDDLTRYDDRSSVAVRNFNFTNLAVGDWLDVRGYEQATGTNVVIASSVLRIEPADGVRLRGPFRSPAQPDFAILSVPVTTSGATLFRLEPGTVLTADAFFTQAVGQLVEAWGSWNGSALAAQRVEIKVRDD